MKTTFDKFAKTNLKMQSFYEEMMNDREGPIFYDPQEEMEKEAQKVLTADMWSRMSMYWPLVLQTPREFRDTGISYEDTYHGIHEEFPFLDMILNKYKGEICAAGGAVANHLFLRENHVSIGGATSDVDLFFYGMDQDRATRILEDCVAMLCCATDYVGYENDQITEQNKTYYRQVRVEKNVKYVNVSFTTDRLNQNGEVISSGLGQTPTQKYKIYQFVLRIYPTLDSIVGGFDVPFSSFLYDGDNFYGTEIADWCGKNKILIANISRRSPSFEYRLVKYCRRFNLSLFFPGLDMGKLFSSTRRANMQQLEIDVKAAIVNNGYTILGIDENQNMTVDDYVYKITTDVCRADWPVFRRISFPRDKSTPRMSFSRHTNLRALNKEQVERISDYSHHHAGNGNIRSINSTSCILNNPDGVIVCLSYVERPRYLDVLDSFQEMTSNPQITVLDGEHLHKCFLQRINSVINHGFSARRSNSVCNIKGLGVGDNIIQMLKQVPTNGRKTAVDYMEHKVFYYLMRSHDTSLERATQNLQGLRWNTKNPTVQWTSSHHPIHSSAKEYYGDFYTRFRVGIPKDVVRTLFTGKNDLSCQLSRLGHDLFRHLLLYILRTYSF
jgi:hypothetical protein